MIEYIKKLLSDGDQPSFGRHAAALFIIVSIVLLGCGKPTEAAASAGFAVTIFTTGKATDK